MMGGGCARSGSYAHGTHPTHHAKQHLDQVGRFSTIHTRYQRKDGQNDHGNGSVRIDRTCYAPPICAMWSVISVPEICALGILSVT